MWISFYIRCSVAFYFQLNCINVMSAHGSYKLEWLDQTLVYIYSQNILLWCIWFTLYLKWLQCIAIRKPCRIRDVKQCAKLVPVSVMERKVTLVIKYARGRLIKRPFVLETMDDSWIKRPTLRATEAKVQLNLRKYYSFQLGPYFRYHIPRWLVREIHGASSYSNCTVDVYCKLHV